MLFNLSVIILLIMILMFVLQMSFALDKYMGENHIHHQSHKDEICNIMKALENIKKKKHRA